MSIEYAPAIGQAEATKAPSGRRGSASTWIDTLRFDEWKVNHRIALVFWIGVTFLVGGTGLRIRVGLFVRELYADINATTLAPIAKTYNDLSLLAIVLGVALVSTSLYSWINVKSPVSDSSTGQELQSINEWLSLLQPENGEQRAIVQRIKKSVDRIAN